MATNIKEGYSFCLITDRREPEKLAREIESIHALFMPAYEILVVEDNSPPFGKLGAMRNRACRMAAYDHLVVADDDFLFHQDFYSGLQGFGEDYDVAACRMLNPDGSRFYDWKVHIDGMNYLVDYDKTDPNISLTGTICIMKKWVFEKVQWSEELGYYEGEDVDFSDRLKAAGMRISFNPHSTVTHDAPYRQAGRRVLRMDFKGKLAYAKYNLMNFFGMNE